MPCMFNKDLTRFMQSLSQVRQSRASKITALLAHVTASEVCLFMGFTNFIAQNVLVVDPGEGPGGPGPLPPLVLDQTEAQRVEKFF